MVSRERWKEGAIVPFAVAVQVGGGSVQVSGTLANNLSQRISNSTLPVPRVSGCLDQRPNLCGVQLPGEKLEPSKFTDVALVETETNNGASAWLRHWRFSWARLQLP
jgi:hypothetical protein